MTTRTRRTRTTQSNAAKLNKQIKTAAAGTVLGSIVMWDTRSGVTHTYNEVKDALAKADLDPTAAREILPTNAFTRAKKRLSDERIIAQTHEDADVCIFQFTKAFLQKEEWEYKKEAFIRLDKVSGLLQCEDDELRERAQQELDKAIVQRTTNDISKIVQRLFDREAALQRGSLAGLMSMRSQGGVYFAPQEHAAFSRKVRAFVESLGGTYTEIELEAGKGDNDRIAQEAVQDEMQRLIDKHNANVESFTLNTRHDTIENAAKKIRDTKAKIQAHAHYLKKAATDLLKQVDESDNKLREQIKDLANQRAKAPAKSAGSNRLFEYPVTAVIRWMGKAQWTFEDAKRAVAAQGVSVADATVRAQLSGGRKGERGAPAELTKQQIAQLDAARKA